MLSSPAGSTLGLGTCVQVLPFQRSVTDRPLASSPTAHALVAEVALTLSSSLLPCGLGLGTCFHKVPFQCSMSVWKAAPLESSPTAQALLDESTATPKRSSVEVPGFGGRSAVQPGQVATALPGAAIRPGAAWDAAAAATGPVSVAADASPAAPTSNNRPACRHECMFRSFGALNPFRPSLRLEPNEPPGKGPRGLVTGELSASPPRACPSGRVPRPRERRSG